MGAWLILRTLAGQAWTLARNVPAIVWVGLLAVVFAISSAHYREQRNEARKEYAAHLAADKAALDKARQDAAAAELRQKQAMAAAAADYEKDKAHALAAQNRVIADLRAGTLKLRAQWRGCLASPGTADRPEAGDGAADLRSESAGRIVRAAADADAQVKYLQGLILAAPACYKVE